MLAIAVVKRVEGNGISTRNAELTSVVWRRLEANIYVSRASFKIYRNSL